MKVDSTMLDAWDKGPCYYFLRHEQGYTRRGVAAPLTFGGVLHLGLAEWYRTAHLGITHAERLRRAEDHIAEGWPSQTIDDATTPTGKRKIYMTPGDDYRTLDKCLDTMRRYARNYAAEPWTVVQGATGPMVEIPFCLPIGAWLDCACGWKANDPNDPPINDVVNGASCGHCGAPLEPIEYGGLIDLVIEHSGYIYNMDHKSTSMLGSTFFTQFRPNAQMTGYTWGVSQLSGREVAGTYINAIGVFAKGETRFERQPTQRTAEEIAEWRRGVIIKCNAIARAKRTGEWDLRTMNCVGKYGACEFLDVHTLPFESDRQRVLSTDYEVRPWQFWEEHR